MRNYFAGGARYVDPNGKMYGLGYEKINNHLTAWIDKSELELRELYFNKKSNILIDSGAFSAFNSGKKINIDDYVNFIHQFNKKWSGKVNSIYFINLDSIGDSKQSWKNQEYLDYKNCKTIPVIHQWGFEEKNLELALSKYDFIAFGGMVGRKQKIHTIPWLNKCYKIIGQFYKKNKIMPKIHLLGVASSKILYRYPCFSCDSTTFMKINRFGSSDYLKIKGLPRTGKLSKEKYKNNKKYQYNQKDDQQLLNRIMIKEIQTIQKEEFLITEFWKKRGIDFEI